MSDVANNEAHPGYDCGGTCVIHRMPVPVYTEAQLAAALAEQRATLISRLAIEVYEMVMAGRSAKEIAATIRSGKGEK